MNVVAGNDGNIDEESISIVDHNDDFPSELARIIWKSRENISNAKPKLKSGPTHNRRLNQS